MAMDLTLLYPANQLNDTSVWNQNIINTTHHFPDSGPGWGPYRIWPGAHQDLTGPRTGMPVMPNGRPDKSRTWPGRDLKGRLTLLWVNHKRGCPCPDWARCVRGSPHQSRTGSDQERYLGWPCRSWTINETFQFFSKPNYLTIDLASVKYMGGLTQSF